jgi:hypothetical protein
MPKWAPTGEETYLAAQAGLSDPTAALANHLRVNTAGPAHLFAWNHLTGWFTPSLQSGIHQTHLLSCHSSGTA